MKTRILMMAVASALILSCKTINAVPPAVPAPAPTVHNIDVNGKIYAAVFQQRAAEYKALCQQAFNIATLRLDEALKQPHQKPLAIVTDIDETFLDNSPYAVTMAKKGQVFDEETWLAWTSKGEALPLQGSHAFFSYAASKGVTIFYISNRSQKDRPGTLANLKKYDFPYADDQHLILRDQISSKEPRRQKVAETHDIILLLGDNLSDLSAAFDKKTEAEREQVVKDNAVEFGKRFIVLPNTGYGDWESALFDYNYKRTPAQKDSIYLSKVKGF